MTIAPIIAPFNLSYLNRTPYITEAEYAAAPTAIDVSNLVVQGSVSAQQTSLSEIIARASSLIDTHCCGTNGTLCASQNTETSRMRSDRRGRWIVHPRFFPILEVDSFTVGTIPDDLTTIPLSTSNCWIEEAQFVVEGYLGGLTSSQGPLELTSPLQARDWECYVQWTYVNGWPNSTLGASVSAAASVIEVESSAGMYPGSALTIYDAPNDEAIQVAETYVGGYGSSTTIPLASPLQYEHAAGVSITALPPTVKQAAILVTSALIQTRGDSALVLGSLNAPTRKQPTDDPMATALDLARVLLHPFKVIQGQT